MFQNIILINFKYNTVVKLFVKENLIVEKLRRFSNYYLQMIENPRLTLMDLKHQMFQIVPISLVFDDLSGEILKTTFMKGLMKFCKSRWYKRTLKM